MTVHNVKDQPEVQANPKNTSRIPNTFTTPYWRIWWIVSWSGKTDWCPSKITHKPCSESCGATNPPCKERKSVLVSYVNTYHHFFFPSKTKKHQNKMLRLFLNIIPVTFSLDIPGMSPHPSSRRRNESPTSSALPYSFVLGNSTTS